MSDEKLKEIGKEEQKLQILKVWHFAILTPLSVILSTIKPKPRMIAARNFTNQWEIFINILQKFGVANQCSC